MSAPMLWTDALHHAFIKAEVHPPTTHVVVRWIVNAAVLSFAFVRCVGDYLFKVSLFVW